MNLTPYDTGERLEPRPWGATALPDAGKVDFENDESTTQLTIHVEYVDGTHVVHVYQHTDTPVKIILEEA